MSLGVCISSSFLGDRRRAKGTYKGTRHEKGMPRKVSPSSTRRLNPSHVTSPKRKDNISRQEKHVLLGRRGAGLCVQCVVEVRILYLFLRARFCRIFYFGLTFTFPRLPRAIAILLSYVSTVYCTILFRASVLPLASSSRAVSSSPSTVKQRKTTRVPVYHRKGRANPGEARSHVSYPWLAIFMHSHVQTNLKASKYSLQCSARQANLKHCYQPPANSRNRHAHQSIPLSDPRRHKWRMKLSLHSTN